MTSLIACCFGVNLANRRFVSINPALAQPARNAVADVSLLHFLRTVIACAPIMKHNRRGVKQTISRFLHMVLLVAATNIC
jgi:hypothetical protein